LIKDKSLFSTKNYRLIIHKNMIQRKMMAKNNLHHLLVFIKTS